jgi:hypothetical protein
MLIGKEWRYTLKNDIVVGKASKLSTQEGDID